MAYQGFQPPNVPLTGTDIAPGSIGGTQIQDGSVTATELSSTAITDKIGYTPAGGSSTGNIGFLFTPQNIQSVAYTAVFSDSGKTLVHPSSDVTPRTFTIPSNSSVSYPVGTQLFFLNLSTGALTVDISGDTLVETGTLNIGAKVLGQNEHAVARKITSVTWLITLYKGIVDLSSSQTLTNKTLNTATVQSAVLQSYSDTIVALTGTTPALSTTGGTVKTWTLSANSSPTDGLTSGQSITLGVTAGSYTVTWPTMTWVKVGGSGVAPTFTSTGVNWVVLWKVGSSLNGAFLGTA